MGSEEPGVSNHQAVVGNRKLLSCSSRLPKDGGRDQWQVLKFYVYQAPQPGNKITNAAQIVSQGLHALLSVGAANGQKALAHQIGPLEVQRPPHAVSTSRSEGLRTNEVISTPHQRPKNQASSAKSTVSLVLEGHSQPCNAKGAQGQLVPHPLEPLKWLHHASQGKTFKPHSSTYLYIYT